MTASVRHEQVPVYEPENYEMYFPPNSPLLLSHDPEDDEEVKPDISHMKVSVRSRACASTTSSSGAAASEASSGKRFHVAEDVDLNREWEYAKFVFRSSVFGMVTFVDHLCTPPAHAKARNLIGMALLLSRYAQTCPQDCREARFPTLRLTLLDRWPAPSSF
eukprot:scaffold298040_cov30-Tisochrysis_lutea.AAC.2